MQNSNPSFAVRFTWECQCGSWGTARTEAQANQAIVAHKERGLQGMQTNPHWFGGTELAKAACVSWHVAVQHLRGHSR